MAQPCPLGMVRGHGASITACQGSNKTETQAAAAVILSVTLGFGLCVLHSWGCFLKDDSFHAAFLGTFCKMVHFMSFRETNYA